MLNVKVGDAVWYKGAKREVLAPPLRNTYFSAYRERLILKGVCFPVHPKFVKPIIRLTPLVRAKMRLKSIEDSRMYYPLGFSASFEDSVVLLYRAIELVESIGGYEAAKLYNDSDGFVNGRFIRGDDVRRALRVLGVS